MILSSQCYCVLTIIEIGLQIGHDSSDELEELVRECVGLKARAE